MKEQPENTKHVKSVVTCLPSKNLKKSLQFYSGCFKLEDLAIEEDSQITIELANLSLFVMSQDAYEKYLQKINMQAGYPQENVHVIHSCAVSDPEMIEHLFATAEQCGGTVAAPMSKNEWGQHTGYLRDPDGHLWEISQVMES